MIGANVAIIIGIIIYLLYKIIGVLNEKKCKKRSSKWRSAFVTKPVCHYKIIFGIFAFIKPILIIKAEINT